MVTKEEEIGGKVSWLGEKTLETRPVKTIELMKTPKDNRCAQVRTHAKRLSIGWEGKVAMPNENDQKKSVLSNVDVIQKFQKSKRRSKRTNTWRWMRLVRRTKRARQNCPNEDYAQCRTNTRETVAWLQKGEAPRFAHLTLF
jgi:hypothetical protein